MRCRRRDAVSDLGGTCESHHADIGMSDERAAGRRAAGNDVEHACGQRVEEFGEPQARERVLVRRLADHRLARGNRGRDRARHQQQRKIERHDRGDDAGRLPARRAGVMRGLRRTGFEHGGGRIDAIVRFAQRLARLACQEGRQFALAVADAGSDLAEQCRPIRRGHVPPFGLRGACRCDGARDFAGPAVRHRAERVQRRRI